MGRLVARGKYLFDGERKFFARGVSYGPFPENSRGERYPEPERVAADFALMNADGRQRGAHATCRRRPGSSKKLSGTICA